MRHLSPHPARQAALIAAATLSALAHAAAADPASPVPSVRVVGHYDNSIGSADAASAGSVTAELIANRPALRTGELLEFVPGVIVTQHSGDGKANQYFLRGFNLDHGTDFATTVDGVPVNMPSHAHGHGYTDLNFVIPELVRRIDYRKGPYYADQGDFASAGAARLRLHDALPEGVASVTVGEHGMLRGLLADTFMGAHGRLLWAVEAAGADGPWEVPQSLERANALLRWSGEHADWRWQLTAMGYRAAWTATDQVPQRAIDDGRVGRFGSLDASDGGETWRTSLQAGASGPWAGGRVSASAYMVRSRLALFSNFTYLLTHPSDLGDPVAGDQFEQAESRRVAGADLSYDWNGMLGERAWSNRVGLSYRHDRLDPVGLHESVARERVATVREDRVRQSSLGLWAETSLVWTPWLRSVLGLRADRFDFDVDSSHPANSGQRSAALVSPKFSLIARPAEDTELFFNAGRGYHSNDARGTVQRVSPTSGDPVDAVTPLAKSLGVEAGLKGEWLPGVQTAVALWQLDLDSELIFVGDAGETEASRPSRRRGVEWTTHVQATPWLLFDLDLAWSRARFTDSAPEGQHVPGAVERVLAFGATIAARGPWSGQFQLRHFGPRALVEDNSVRSQATTLAYLRASYDWRPGTRVTLDVFNLFDTAANDIEYFYASRLAGEPAEGVEDRHLHPVEPRSLRLTLRTRF